MPYTPFSLIEVAEYLQVPPAEVELWARRGEIPCERRGDRFVFRRGDVELWASCRLLEGEDRWARDYHSRSVRAQGGTPMPILPDLINRDRINTNLSCRTRASVIRDMVDLADSTGLLNYADDLRAQIEARESESSTALAGGIALLHPGRRDPYLIEDSFLVFGRTIQTIPFGSPDGKGTDLFFLLCCRDDRLHLHALARLCRLCYHSPLIPALRAAADPQECLNALLESERFVLSGKTARPAS